MARTHADIIRRAMRKSDFLLGQLDNVCEIYNKLPFHKFLL